ncbi:MAG: nucleotidyltransferase domain-containing protein [Bacteroidota bacterium]
MPTTELIAAPVRSEIQARLQQIETEEGVRLFFACESGSRAWGFPSADSDYDVRFLYAHSPDWYLSIDLERKRDVIERPISDELDLSGWDLRKALQLFRKSNPPLIEWLQSPIVYREQTEVAARFRALIPRHFSPQASLHHYLSMARSTYRHHLNGEYVRLKKYFYVLRPLLAVQWIEADLGPVPMEFDTLVNHLVTDAALKASIQQLLAAKRAGEELDQGPRIPALSDFVEHELNRLESGQLDHHRPSPDVEELNRFFRSALDTLWNDVPRGL